MTDSLTHIDEILDDDGYPADDVLDLIPRWTGTPRALIEDVISPIFAAYGHVRVDPATDDLSRDVMCVRLVTGGWSGCESVVSALKQGFFWNCWWQSSERGGTHLFETPVSFWESPLLDWSTVVDAQARLSDPRAWARHALVTALFGSQASAHDDIKVATELGAVTVTLLRDGRRVARRTTTTASHAFRILLG